MNRITLRRLGFWLLCAVACGWVLVVLLMQWLRYTHHEMVQAVLQKKTAEISTETLDEAIRTYQQYADILPCNTALYKDLVLLTSVRADKALSVEESQDAERYLNQTLEALYGLTVCSPGDGKAWLDIAVISVYAEGFSEASLTAYKRSQNVAPGESWLAQKRLFFAHPLRELFDAEARAAARSDVATLMRAHPIRLKPLLKLYKVKTPEELAQLFTEP